MNRLFRSTFLSALAVSFVACELAAQNPPAAKTLNTVRTFPEIKTRAAWKERAGEIREQVLVSCGLWPLPEKTPLHANVFGKIERAGYSIEKVYFQTYPGFYLAGNLYRPLGKGRGPFPGVLNPHGHWANGRMADTKDGSIAARCISFARQGMVAFTYDMVGYNDTRFPEWPADGKFADLHWQVATNRANQLWNVNLMGLQTWNSIRALDFLASLPDVDKKRLACTGESGGGTQTFMLGAVDDRLAVQGPIVMVSSTMQGGCLCENAPGLRVEYSNMEIAAAAAPRPQILVAASGDWTKKTMEVEGPAIESVYRLFIASAQLRYVRFDFGHNYNQTSREAVYEWFGKWLLKHPDAASLKEQPYHKEPDADLRVFPDGKPPADALPMEEFIESRKQSQREAWQKLVPHDRAEFKKFQSVMLPAWRHTLQTKLAVPELRSRIVGKSQRTAYGRFVRLDLERDGSHSPVVLVRADAALSRNIFVLVNPKGRGAYLGEDGTLHGLAGQLIAKEQEVLLVDSIGAGDLKNPEAANGSDPFLNFFTTYNRTVLQERVGDIVAACAFARAQDKDVRVVLCGEGRAGLWAQLAAPAADAVIADCGGLDVSSDEALLAPDLFAPGLRSIGSFEGAAMLAAPHPLLLHNTGGNFSTSGIQSAYQALRSEKKLRVETKRLTEDELLERVSKL